MQGEVGVGPCVRHWLVVCGLLFFGSSARASDGALAEEMFRQGQSLMTEGRYAEACPKLAESQRLDPTTGTLLNLAVCHEKQGLLATAWNEFNEAIALAKRDGREDRQRFAEEHIAAIEPRLARLSIEVLEAERTDGLEVRLDGTVVGSAAFGVALPVDVGEHEVSASALGKEPWTGKVTVAGEGTTTAFTLPALSDAPASEQPTASSDGAEDAGGHPGRTQRIVAFGTAGLGLVAIGIGTGFGVDALSKFNASNEGGCDENDCDSAGADLRDAARASGDVATVAFIAGAVLVSTGVVLYFTAPKAQKSAERANAALRSVPRSTPRPALGPSWASVRPAPSGAGRWSSWGVLGDGASGRRPSRRSDRTFGHAAALAGRRLQFALRHRPTQSQRRGRQPERRGVCTQLRLRKRRGCLPVPGV